MIQRRWPPARPPVPPATPVPPALPAGDDRFGERDDALLRLALAHTPDREDMPRAATRSAIHQAAHKAVAPSPDAAIYLDDSAWHYWWRRITGQGRGENGGWRMPWNTAFATVLLAGGIGLLWHGQEVPDARLDSESAPTLQASRPAAAPDPTAAPAAPSAASPGGSADSSLESGANSVGKSESTTPPRPGDYNAGGAESAARARGAKEPAGNSAQSLPATTPAPAPAPAPVTKPAAPKGVTSPSSPSSPSSPAAPVAPASRAGSSEAPKSVLKLDSPTPPDLARDTAPPTESENPPVAAKRPRLTPLPSVPQAERAVRAAKPSTADPSAADSASPNAAGTIAAPAPPASASGAASSKGADRRSRRAAPTPPAAAFDPNKPVGLPSFSALAEWRRATIVRTDGASRNVGRANAGRLAPLLGSAAISAVNPQQLRAPVEYRVVLENAKGERLASIEIAGDKVRWREGSGSGTTGEPSAGALGTLRSALDDALSR